jgi:hypothetical protein
MKREVLPPRHSTTIRAAKFAVEIALVFCASAGAIFGVARLRSFDCEAPVICNRRRAVRESAR